MSVEPLQPCEGKDLHGCIAVNVVMCFLGELVVGKLKAISFF